MRFATSPRLLHTGREDREAKLKEFIADAITSAHSSAGQTCFTLLARAPDSPVARALASLAAELAAAGIVIRIVMLDLDTYTDEPGRPTLLEMNQAEIRLIADPRFAAAHEQLVLCDGRMWLGDCMRRDPAKRDAFEIFHENNAAAETNAAISFARIWNSAQAVRRVRAIAPELVLANQIADETATQLPRR